MVKKIPRTELVEIMPIEYSFMPTYFSKRAGRRKTKNPRLQIPWDYTFSQHLTQEIFNKLVANFEHKSKIHIQSDSDRFIVYQYEGKPKIYLDKLTNKMLVTRGTMNHYSKQHCQQQASFILRILKGSKKDRLRRPAYASFKRISVTCDPYRIGRTKEERQIYFEAVMDLFNDKPKARLKKIREAAHTK